MEAKVQVQPVESIELQLQPAKTCKHEKSTEGPNISLVVASQVRILTGEQRSEDCVLQSLESHNSLM